MSDNNKDFSLSDINGKYGSDENINMNEIELLFRELSYPSGTSSSDTKKQSSAEHTDRLIHESEKTLPVGNRKTDEPSVSASADRPKQPGRRVIFSADDLDDIAKVKDTENEKAPEKKEPAVSDEKKREEVVSRLGSLLENDIEGKDLAPVKLSAEDNRLYEEERSRALGNGETGFRKFIHSVIPMKGDPKKEIVRKSVLLTSVAVIIFCGIWFANYSKMHYRQLENDSGHRSELITTKNDAEDEEKQWAKIKAAYPDVVFPEGMNIAYAKLYAKNSDMVGWLTVPNTNIDTPIVQCKDDTDSYQYYLKHDFYKKDNKYGNPFMIYADDVENLSDNLVINGHNMYDGLMFADLEKYLTVDGYYNSPVITFNTLTSEYKWKIFAVIVTNGNSSGDNGYLFDFTVTCFMNREKKEQFIEALKERSLYDTGVDVTADDKLLTLNTCCYEFDDARLGVVARLVRNGESEEVDTSAVRVNENVRYPQAYYDKKGIANPYRDAFRWYAALDE